MPRNRTLALGFGVALAAASLTVAGTVASYASPTGLTAPSLAPRTHGAVPDPNAPHVGTVAGLQTGPDIAMRNHSSVHAFRVLHQSMLSGRGAGGDDITTIHPSKGTSFDANTMGSQATQSVSTKIHVGNPGTTLYTPTMYPSAGDSDGSCVEMSTAYFFGSQYVAAWDWCVAITFVAQVPIDKSFMKTYTKHHFYSTQIVQTNPSSNTWTSYLYNYKTKQWETFFSQHGQSQISPSTPGWDVYELYSELDGSGQSYACQDLEGKRVAAKHILVGVGGNLVPADDGNAGQVYDSMDTLFHCDSFSYSMIKRLSHWRAIG